MSKAVVFFAEGTEECEALLVVDLLRRAKVEVTVASASGSREIVSSHKVHITADALAEEVDYSDVDMVVLPGGIPGTPNLAANKTVTDTCVSFAQAGKKVAAICAAPSVLAQLGLLEGRKATAHAGFQDQLVWAVPFPLRWSWCASWPDRLRPTASGTPSPTATEGGSPHAFCYLPPAGRRRGSGHSFCRRHTGLAPELAGPFL